MRIFNLSFFLNAYADPCKSNAPSQENFRWNTDINTFCAEFAVSKDVDLAPGESQTLFNTIRTLSQDITTQYSLALMPLSSTTYVLSWVGGTAPNFRTPRTTGADATTQVTTTVNGQVVTFTAPSISAAFASFTGNIPGMTSVVTITANNIGAGGNSVVLYADGVSTISQLITAWNIANPSNQITLTAGDGTQIPFDGGSIHLSGGVSSATAFNLISGGVVVGDTVSIGSPFNNLNQGVFTVISVSATSFSVQNYLGVAEGPYVLGADFASEISIYSAAGVQIGDTLSITAGFSPASWGNYKVTQVYANSLEFSSTAVLPQEGPITTQVALYESALQFIYLQTNQAISVILNGGSAATIRPLIDQNKVNPGIFVRSDTIYSVTIQNISLNPAKVWVGQVG